VHAHGQNLGDSLSYSAIPPSGISGIRLPHDFKHAQFPADFHVVTIGVVGLRFSRRFLLLRVRPPAGAPVSGPATVDYHQKKAPDRRTALPTAAVAVAPSPMPGRCGKPAEIV